MLTTLYAFCSQTNCSDGSHPQDGLVQATDGSFYSTTVQGGANGFGTIFKITSAGRLTTLYSFCSQTNCPDGSYPATTVLQATSGTFYGTTVWGGVYGCSDGSGGCGTVFSLSVGLDPFVAFVRTSGKVGQAAGILGQGFTGTTAVSFNGNPAAFTVKSDTFLAATVPTGATTGTVQVTTPSGVQLSNVPFRVLP